MIKKITCILLFLCGTTGAHTADESVIYQEIKQIVARTKMDCAQLVYHLVRQEIDVVGMHDDSSMSLFEQVVPVFVSSHMKKIITIAGAYCSEPVLYELAARLAAQANDIDALIVLSIAAGQKRTASYGKSIYMFGVATGALVLWGARTVCNCALRY